MENDFYFIELFEIYKGLLTDKQREMFNSHYLLDLSFAEIAETEGKSRQSIYDAIKIVKEKLIDFERQLNIKEKKDKIFALIEKDDSEQSKQIKDIIGR